MIWYVGAICMVLFGALGVAVGLYLPMFAYAIVGGILLLGGIFWLVSFRRSEGPVTRNLRD